MFFEDVLSLHFSVGNWWANIATVLWHICDICLKIILFCFICGQIMYKIDIRRQIIPVVYVWHTGLKSLIKLSAYVVVSLGQFCWIQGRSCVRHLWYSPYTLQQQSLMYIVIYHINNRNGLICRWKIYSYHNKNVYHIARSQCWLFASRANIQNIRICPQISVLVLKYPYWPSNIPICPRI
jgi:hypothetical protein